MATTIVNGAGMNIRLGTNDVSTTVVPTAAEQIPQHLPIFFLFTQKGSGRALVDGDSRTSIFGTTSFDPRSDYFTHATAFSNEAMAQGNAHIIQRLQPDDAGPNANAILWLDVLETTVDLYQRNSDGSIYYDTNGDPVVTDTAAGMKVKWVVTYNSTTTAAADFGSLTQTAGDQVDATTSDTSIRYPIMEIANSYFGADGNNTCFRLWAPTATAGASLPTDMMSKYSAYPYYIQILSREDSTESPTVEKTTYGEASVMFTFQQGVINPLTDQQLSWDKIITQSYDQIDVPGYPDVRGRIGDIYVYNDQLDTVLTMFHGYEKDYITATSDITSDVSTRGLLNFVTGVDSTGVEYQSYVFVEADNASRMSQYDNVYLAGGSDGTMDNDTFEALVVAEMNRYADATDDVQDTATNVESVFYDSGFSLDTKLELASLISVRKDTVVILGTHTVGEDALTASEEHSLAVSLRTRLQMYPESTYFGTPVCRAMIMGRSGIIRDSEYTERVPATFEVLNHLSKYMGSSDGTWKNGSSPEGNPGSIVSRLKNVNVSWVSESVRNQDWSVGLNWVLNYDRSSLFIPHMKTVYDDDTSVLNSILVAFAIGQLNKVADKCWRFFSGRSDLTNAQLTSRVNEYIRANTVNRFDSRYLIVPTATVTDMDALRGFSWTLNVKIGANNMKTVQTSYVQSYRYEDLAAAA